MVTTVRRMGDGYPKRVEEYMVDVVPINEVIKKYRTAYLFGVYDSDGQLVGFTVDRARSDMLCYKLTASDRQSQINKRMQMAVTDAETRELPPKLRTHPDTPRSLPGPEEWK